MKGICVGMGGRGKGWYRWAQAAGVEVVGVVDLNAEVLSAACDELEIPESMRFTKMMTSRDFTFAINRISAISTEERAWCADSTTTQIRLSRIERIVICSRIMKVSFTPGVSRMQSPTGNSGRCMKMSADLVMSANLP